MSSRLEGFEVMDVSTSLLHDPKIRRLSRDAPEQLTPGFMAYVATVAESWRAGDRVSIDDAWPSYMPFDEATVEALKAARLLDDEGRVPVKAWRGWFSPARKRRESARRRWHDWKERQRGKSPESNGNAHGKQTQDKLPANGLQSSGKRESVPTVPTESESTPPTPSPARGRTRKNDPRDPRFAQYDDKVQRDDDAPDWMRS